MGRLAFILRHRLPVIIFIIVAVIGGILIFWYISNKEDHNNRNQEISGIQESISDNEYSDTEISGENDFSGYYGQQLSSSIPHGLRAISLPISFFGEVSSIREGDRVDIISVFYDPGSNELYSEVILNEKEIIIFENNYISRTASGYEVTALGIDRVRSNLNSAKLDEVRIEILNSQQRKNTMVKTVNF